MRVIAGKARRTILSTIEGLSTRPTTDRIKETLFNMINNELYEVSFLDLFAGSGGIGIEALSRGANKAVFIENNKAAIKCIKDNINKTHFNNNAVVVEQDYLSALKFLETKKEVFDIIFMDPPYNNEYEKNVLKKLSDSSLIHNDTLIIVEASKETKMDYIDEYGFELIKKKDYKTNYHVFLMRKKENWDEYCNISW